MKYQTHRVQKTAVYVMAGRSTYTCMKNQEVITTLNHRRHIKL